MAVGADRSHKDYCSSFPQLKEHWHRNSPAVPAEANRNRKTNGSSPETSTSAGCHSARDVSLGGQAPGDRGPKGQ